MLVGNKITGEHIVIDESAVIDSDARPDTGPRATFEDSLRRAECQHRLLLRAAGQRLSPDQNVRVVRCQRAQQVGKRALSPAVFAEDERAGAEAGTGNGLALFKPADILDVHDRPERRE